MKQIGILLLLVSCTSCATIFNGKTQDIKLILLSEADVVMNGDTLQPNSRGVVKVNVERTWLDTSFALISDSNRVEYKLESNLGGAYYFNWLTPYFAGFIVDWTRDVRYNYPGRVYVDINEDQPTLHRYSPWQRKGDVNLRVSLPYYTQYQWQVEDYGSANGRGFIGISAGVEYFYTDNQFASFNILSQTSYPYLLPLVPLDRGVTANLNTISFTNNHQVGVWSLGYGVSFVQKEFVQRISNGIDPWFGGFTTESTNYDCLGLIGQGHLRLFRTLHAGLIFQPTFVRLGSADAFRMEHNLTFDILWRIPIYEGRRY
ncbi:MAG: hypothetical protein HWD92_11310 [Flavobacteriia bacterium]|nr:hypothetical protein [Flavobacteriia bacterium]